MRETRYTTRRRAERDAEPLPATQAGRALRLLVQTRRDMAELLASDRPRRRRICAELDAMITDLQSTLAPLTVDFTDTRRPKE